MSTASARHVTPHVMRGPVTTLFRAFLDSASWRGMTGQSTASAVLRQYLNYEGITHFSGTYVYCFGGIETNKYIH